VGVEDIDVRRRNSTKMIPFSYGVVGCLIFIPV